MNHKSNKKVFQEKVKKGTLHLAVQLVNKQKEEQPLRTLTDHNIFNNMEETIEENISQEHLSRCHMLLTTQHRKLPISSTRLQSY